jgi:hypothetical protein
VVLKYKIRGMSEVSVSNLSNHRRAVARVGVIFLVVMIIAVALAAFYIFYFPNSYHSTSNKDTLTLTSFTLNPQNSTLKGTVNMASNSLISTLGLYINGTYFGSETYSTIKSMMTTLVGGNYKYTYSLAYTKSLPTNSSITFVQNKTYLIVMTGTFSDGSTANGTITVHT